KITGLELETGQRRLDEGIRRRPASERGTAEDVRLSGCIRERQHGCRSSSVRGDSETFGHRSAGSSESRRHDVRANARSADARVCRRSGGFRGKTQRAEKVARARGVVRGEPSAQSEKSAETLGGPPLAHGVLFL